LDQKSSESATLLAGTVFQTRKTKISDAKKTFCVHCRLN
jgi:hypothetical protein